MINILLVEDNAINQFVAVKMLQRWGMKVMVANHGQEALALIGSKSFQLILMDLEMPVMDGYESTRRIREMEDSYFKTVPIIAFTASEIWDARGKALHSGMTDIVAKPLQTEEFQTTIDKYISRPGANGSATRSLNIDFDQYTDGDADFKRELISLMIGDIKELQNCLAEANQLNDPEMFFRGCHKSKTTLNMVNDEELIFLLEELKAQIGEEKENKTALFANKVLLFNRMSGNIITSLSDLSR